MKRSELAASLQQILIVLEKKCSANDVADELEYLADQVGQIGAAYRDDYDVDDWIDENGAKITSDSELAGDG